VQLIPGDLIVVFSDGVSEAMNEAGEEYSDERLMASLTANASKPLQQILDALFADVKMFCGDATQSDDITAVLVRYCGPGTA